MATGEEVSTGGGDVQARTAYLVLDTESIPDGRLLSLVKYAEDNPPPEEAVRRAQAEAREQSRSGSDFLPVSYQVPVAVCVARVSPEYELLKLTCLDAPQFRPREIVGEFWRGLARHNRVKLVTFNGRGFDLPLLELAAFRYGCCGRDYFLSNRNRYQGNHLDLMDWLTNFNAYRLVGGLDLLSKILGKPGKMDIHGEKVYDMYRAGQAQEINDYCMFDTLDTYFVFLRTRVVAGEISLGQEQQLVRHAKQWITDKVKELPALSQYLDNWGDWAPWP
jgi:predicted PolB exonuclease-like 3'-5' exonuclease